MPAALAQLRGCHLTAAGEIVEARHVRPLEPEFRHFFRLDALDAAVDARDQNGKGLEALLHICVLLFSFIC